MAKLLSLQDRKKNLDRLDGWKELEGRDAITRSFKFRNFAEAFSFMTEIAFVAEKMNHHPEWENIYDTVRVILSTHSAGGLTKLDVELADAMVAAATRYSRQ